MIVSMKDGVVHCQFSDVSKPNRDLEDQGRRLRDKFSVLASPVIGSAGVREVIGLVSNLESLDRAEDGPVGLGGEVTRLQARQGRSYVRGVL